MKSILLLFTLSNLFCFLCAQRRQVDYGDPVVNAVVQFLKDVADVISSIAYNVDAPKDIAPGKLPVTKKITLLPTLGDVSSAKPSSERPIETVPPPKKPSSTKITPGPVTHPKTVPPKKEPSPTKKTTLLPLQFEPVKTPQTIPPLKQIKTLPPVLQNPTQKAPGVTQKDIQPVILNNSTTSTSTTPPPPTILCTNNDLTFPDTTDCRKYYVCQYGSAISRQCMMGTSWNCFQSRCAFLMNDVCCNSVYKTADPGTFCFVEGKRNVNPYDETRFYECVSNRVVNKVCPYGTVYNHGFYKCMKKVSF